MSEIPPPTVPPATPPPSGGSYTPPGGSYTPPPTPPGSFPPAGSSDRTLMVVLSYLWILCLIPLLTKKDDPEVQWHAKNGTALLGVEVIVWIAFFVLRMALRFMACGFAAIECAVWILFLVARIMCIVKGVGGQRFRIPVVTDFAEKM